MAKLTLNLTGQSVKLPVSLRGDEPTHVSRYWIIAQILKSLGDENIKILDVGGKEGLLRTFGYKPTVIDMEDSDEPNFIQGNALDMPFSDTQFDVSVSCDVLEHIEPADRHQFIAEMTRVSKVAIVCAPFDHAGMPEAENDINDYYKSLLKKGHRWLQEHIDNGLPSEEKTVDTIKKLGYEYVKTRHFSLSIWPLVLKAHLLHAAYGDSEPIALAAKNIYEDYYDNLCAHDFSENGYRTFFIIAKDDLELKMPSAAEVSRRRLKFNENLTDQLFSTVENQAKDRRDLAKKNGRLEANLAKKNNEAEALKTELKAIKSSRSWKVASSLSRAKRLGR